MSDLDGNWRKGGAAVRSYHRAHRELLVTVFIQCAYCLQLQNVVRIWYCIMHLMAQAAEIRRWVDFSVRG